MAHTHSVIDDDLRFIIDPSTREIGNGSQKVKLMQYDHNSERFTFEIPRFVEGHDMSLCNSIRVNYININKSTGEQNPGVYEVSDTKVEEGNIIFSWLVSLNATQYAGPLNFLIKFICFDEDDHITYEWHTDIFKSASVYTGMNIEESIDEVYPDILEKWKNDVLAAEASRINAESERVNAESERANTFAGYETEINQLRGDFVELDSRLSESITEISGYQNSFNDSFFNYETHSKNYFDYDTAEVGKLINNRGEVVDSSGNVVSAFIVIPTNSVNLNVLANYSNLNRYVTPSGTKVAYYEADGTFISIFTLGYTDGINNFLVPSNAKLIRIQTPYTELGTQTSAYGSGTLMVMFDTTERPTVYIPCSTDITGKLKESALPVLIPTKTSELTNDSGFVSESADYKGLIWCVMGDSWSDNANTYATKRYYDWVADKTGLVIEERSVSGSGFARGDANAFNSVSERIPVNSNLVTVYGSFNDLGADVGLPLGLETDDTTSSLAGCMNITFKNILTRCLNAHVICFSPSPWIANMPTHTTSREYVDMLKKVAERNGVMFVDMFTTMSMRPNDETFRTKYYNTDGVHPNDEGHKWLYPRFLTAIKSVLPTI